MTIPCTQEGPINEIRSDLQNINSNVDRLCSSNAELIIEMKDMTKTLVAHMVDNKEHHVKIEVLEKGADLVFARVRRLEDELCPAMSDSLRQLESEVEALPALRGKLETLENWNNKMKGVILVVPVTCTVLSTAAAVLAIWISLNK